MASFDWVSFLTQYNIDHVTSGHNARRGWVGVKCPYCGDDPSHHLGINLTNGIYHCFRSASHRGRSPYNLIMTLIGCSRSEAESIYNSGSISFVRTGGTLSDGLRRIGVVITEEAKTRNSGPIKFLPEFLPLQNTGFCSRFAYPYLNERGYSNKAIDWLFDRYGLMYSPKGVFSYRIIIPIYVHMKLVNWTGRSIAKSEELRYKSLSTDSEKSNAQGLPTALISIKETLFDWDNIKRGGSTLVVTEGTFDAMRVGYLGEPDGIKSTCLFGKLPTLNQIDLLYELADRYEDMVLLFDSSGTSRDALMMPEYLKLRTMRLPVGVNDPAELSADQFAQLDW